MEGFLWGRELHCPAQSQMRHPLPHPHFRTSLSLLKIVLFMATVTFPPTWPARPLLPAHNSPEPHCWSSLFLCPGSLALGHRVKQYNLSVSEERLLPPERLERDDITFLLFDFFLAPLTLSFIFKTIKCQQGVAIFVFSLQEYGEGQRNLLCGLSQTTAMLFFVILTWSQKRWKEKTSCRPPGISQYLGISFFTGKTQMNFSLFTKAFCSHTDNVTALALSRGKVSICCWEMIWRVLVGSLLRGSLLLDPMMVTESTKNSS